MTDSQKEEQWRVERFETGASMITGQVQFGLTDGTYHIFLGTTRKSMADQHAAYLNSLEAQLAERDATIAVLQRIRDGWRGLWSEEHDKRLHASARADKAEAALEELQQRAEDRRLENLERDR